MDTDNDTLTGQAARDFARDKRTDEMPLLFTVEVRLGPDGNAISMVFDHNLFKISNKEIAQVLRELLTSMEGTEE